MDRRHLLKRLAFAGAGSVVGAPFALAQDFPARPIKVTTAFPPGAGPETLLRTLAEHLGQVLGQPIVVDNKAGGNGFVAVNAWRQGSKDGHDLIHLDSNHITTHPHTFNRLPYKVQDDFTPLAMIQRASFFVAVAANSPFRTVDDLIAAAKAKPGVVNYGSWGTGSAGHIGALRLAAMKQLQMTHIPFRDFGALYTAVATKEVDWALGSAASSGEWERSGRLRFLALAAPARDPQFPNVPATAELPSLRGYEVTAWTGLFGPKPMPVAAHDRLIRELSKVMAKPEVQQRYRAISFEAPNIMGDAFSDLIGRETQAWAEIIRAANLKLDN